MKLLLDAGADMNAQRTLFPGGVNVPMSDPSFGVISPLALAIYYGDPGSAALLLDRGPVLNGTNGFTPVAGAAFSGLGDWVKELVGRGGQVNFDEGFVGHRLNNQTKRREPKLAPFRMIRRQIISPTKKPDPSRGSPWRRNFAWDRAGTDSSPC